MRVKSASETLVDLLMTLNVLIIVNMKQACL
jgi:hypothetical protein